MIVFFQMYDTWCCREGTGSRRFHSWISFSISHNRAPLFRLAFRNISFFYCFPSTVYMKRECPNIKAPHDQNLASQHSHSIFHLFHSCSHMWRRAVSKRLLPPIDFDAGVDYKGLHEEIDVICGSKSLVIINLHVVSWAFFPMLMKMFMKTL